MATANPAANMAVYRQAGIAESPAASMTLSGTALKTMVLVVVLLVGFGYSWSQAISGLTASAEGPRVIPASAIGLLTIGAIGAFVVAMVTIFIPRAAPLTAPIYAVLEGLALGGISGVFETVYPGIAFEAVVLTVGTLVVMLVVYATGVIRATRNFVIGIVAATGGICLVYLADFIASLFGVRLPVIHESGWLGIGFSLFIVIVAALNLILDFDFIERGVESQAPKYMEWYGGFSLLVTLVWLYLEMLRLLTKLRNSRN